MHPMTVTTGNHANIEIDFICTIFYLQEGTIGEVL